MRINQQKTFYMEMKGF